MNITIFLLLIAIGLLAGLFSGVLGVGGGVIMIPLMAFALGFTQHEAQGTSLAVLAIPVTFLAAYNYYNAGYVNWRYALIIAATFIIGGYFGSRLAISVDQNLLRKIFGVILILVAVKMIFQK